MEFFASGFAQTNYWASLAPYSNAEVDVIYNDTVQNQLVIAGNFRRLGTDTIYGIATWDGHKFDSLGKGINNYPGSLSYNLPTLRAMCRFKNKLYVGGGFSKVGAIEHNFMYLASWDGAQWDTVGLNVNGTVLDIKVFNDTMYVCGNFSLIGSLSVHNVAMFDGTNWHSVGFPIQDAVAVNLQFYHDDLYLTGYFYDSTGHQHQMMRRHNGIWEFMEQDVNGSSDWTGAMAVYDDKLIVSGYFYQSWGNADNNIMAWDGTQWNSMGGGTGFGNDPAIRTIFVYNDKLYALGDFKEAGGIPANRVAIWDGQKWCGLEGIFDNSCLAGAFYEDTLFVGGGFTHIDSDQVSYLAQYTGGSYVDTCSIAVGISEINPFANSKITIYPNPSNGNFYIETNKNLGISRIEIRNSLGQIINLQTRNLLTQPLFLTVNLAAGVYLLSIRNSGGVYFQSVIIL